MNALILAAGFGTRLKPWTDFHPKALVPVNGIPMLQRVLMKLEREGFTSVVINTHHFADQIESFVNNYESTMSLKISDERDHILDTGGGLLKAGSYFNNDQPVLVHNVDILSDAPLSECFNIHIKSDNDISLITNDRQSSRSLVFNNEGLLCGWHNKENNLYKPTGFVPQDTFHESAFSGIYIIGKNVVKALQRYSAMIDSDSFPIMDFFLYHTPNLENSNKTILNNESNESSIPLLKISEIKLSKLNLIDIGKPHTLAKANEIEGLL